MDGSVLLSWQNELICVRLWNILSSDHHVSHICLKNVLTYPPVNVQLILNCVVIWWSVGISVWTYAIVARFQAVLSHPLFGSSSWSSHCNLHLTNHWKTCLRLSINSVNSLSISSVSVTAFPSFNKNLMFACAVPWQLIYGTDIHELIDLHFSSLILGYNNMNWLELAMNVWSHTDVPSILELYWLTPCV